ncbi:MAG: pilus assembly protein [Clostridia bacterium]|nr:pilus assembly protein [Clostridia bacterium]
MNRNILKYIAVAAMLCDHIALAFVGMDNPLGIAMRIFGRLTAPIMCYFLVEGYVHTHSKNKYAARLFVFALISQIPFAYFLAGDITVRKFNMMFTLFLCFMLLIVIEKVESRVLKFILALMIYGICDYCDWGLVAPLWVMAFAMLRNDKKKLTLVYALICLFWVVRSTTMAVSDGGMWYEGLWQAGSLAFIPLIYLYNGEAGKSSKFSKWFFYWFYPVHILIIAVIYRNGFFI